MPNIYPNSQPQPYYGVNGKLTDDAKALPVPKKVFILDTRVSCFTRHMQSLLLMSTPSRFRST